MTLRKAGKKTFLTSNSPIEWVEAAMLCTLGPQWENYFDKVIGNCMKPLWQSVEAPFYEYSPFSKTKKEKKLVTADRVDASLTNLLLEGNATVLTQYLQKTIEKEQINIAYFAGSSYAEEFATQQLNNKLIKSGSKARWDCVFVD
jgi:hypothetical protein